MTLPLGRDLQSGLFVIPDAGDGVNKAVFSEGNTPYFENNDLCCAQVPHVLPWLGFKLQKPHRLSVLCCVPSTLYLVFCFVVLFLKSPKDFIVALSHRFAEDPYIFF